MKKIKKIILCICISSILLTVLVVPCFAMWTYGNNESEMNTYTHTLGIPFEVSITGVSPTNYNLISTINDFGAVHYSTTYDYTNGIGNKYDDSVWESSSLNYPAFNNSHYLLNSIESYTFRDGSTNFREFYNKQSTAKFTIDPIGSLIWRFTYTYPNADLNNSSDLTLFRQFLSRNFSGIPNINSYENGVVSGYTFCYDDIISSDAVLDPSINSVFPHYVEVVQLCDERTVIDGGNLRESYIDSIQYYVYYSYDILYRDEYDEFVVQTVNDRLSYPLSNSLAGENVYSAGDIRDVAYWSEFNSYYPEGYTDSYVYPMNIRISLSSILYNMESHIENGVMGFRNLKFSIVGSDGLAISPYNRTGNDYLAGYKRETNNQPLISCSLVYEGLSTKLYNNELVDTPTFLYRDFDSEYNARKDVIYLDNSFNPISWLGDTLGGLFNVDIFGSVSIGDILLVAIGCGFVLLILKFFAGG